MMNEEMNQYLEFLNLMEKLKRILILEKLINDYKKAIVQNQDCPEIIPNLTKTCKEYQKECFRYLKTYKNKEEIIEQIFSKLPSIKKLILESKINVELKTNKESLPLYGLILEIVQEREEFTDFYNFIIEHNFYNPNVSCGISDEPFFSILPTNTLKNIKESNKKIMVNPSTDFHILRNGSDFIESVIFWYHNAKSLEEKKYFQELLLCIFKGNGSLLDSKRFKYVSKNYSYEQKPTIYSLFSENNQELEKVKEYLLTPEGIKKQCENALYPSLARNEAINFYLSMIKEQDLAKNLLKLKIK